MTANHAKGGEFATARRGSLDAHDIAFITSKRDGGFPDAAIAKMIGRSVSYLQALPNIVAPVEVARPVAPPVTPPERVSPPKAANGKRLRRYEKRSMPLRIRAIVDRIAERHGFTVEDLTGDSRKALVTFARQEAYATIREFRRPSSLACSYSLPTIGLWFGGRDHTTVLAGIRAHWLRVGAEARREAA